MAILTLSEEDKGVIRKLRDRRPVAVLQNVNGHKLDQKKGAILVSCGDADQFLDLFTVKVNLQNNCCDRPGRIQPITPNGGPLRLPLNTPANRPGSTYDVDLLIDIQNAADWKGLQTVVLCAHAPCGHAAASGISVTKTLALLISAKVRIKQECGAVNKVACFLHVDYPNGRKRTYFLSVEEFLRSVTNGEV